MMKKIFMLLMVLASLLPLAQAQVTSALWGTSGEAWNPTNSILRDFTHAGYKGGAEPIPGTKDWTNAVSVLDYGAIPDDAIDDSDAFIAAISNCPNYSAVFVPKGRYLIAKKIIVERNHVVLRGEDMYGSILFFPKYTSEVYIEQVGWQPDDKIKNTADGSFISLSGGEEKGIENLTLQFREQRKISPWEYIGANCMTISGSNSWARNLYIVNYDSGVQVNGKYNTVMNTIFDQFNGRQAVDNDSNGKLDAYSAVLPRNQSYCLFHNIDITGHLLQPIDNNEASTWSVYSKISTGEGNNRVVGLHGGSTHDHLYTELNRAVTRHDTTDLHMNWSDCTYWNIDAPISGWAYSNGYNNSIYVGYGDDWTFKSNSSIYYEPAAYNQLTPTNLYLAQLEKLGKPLPDDFVNPPLAPYEREGDVFRVVPVDDATPDEGYDWGLTLKKGAYFKFDLSQATETNVAAARLRVTLKKIVNDPFRVAAYSISDDSWVETNLTTSNKPAVGPELDSEWISSSRSNLVVELDVTSFVRTELVGGDGVVSLYVDYPEGNGFLSTAWNAEVGQKPELIVERTPDSVPGPPSAPKGIRSTALVGNIIFDWDDNPESDIATYNVYRTPSADGWLPQSGGLVTSDHVDVSSTDDWHTGMMDYRQLYHYWITAVDEHGYESEKSREFVAAVVHPSNNPPAFAAGLLGLSNATPEAAYSGSVAGDASDPESDPMYFMKVSGPDWLNVALDGTLSGTPAISDAGNAQVIIQVTALGGSDQAVFSITVGDLVDDPPGAPVAPAGMIATAGASSVNLDWDDNTEGDLAGYNVYRSTSSGSYGPALTSGLGSSDYFDSTAVAGTTYHYVVTAVDSSGNESIHSDEVSATPVQPSAVVIAYYPFSGSSLVSADSDANSVAGDMVVGAGVTTFKWETRAFWSPTQPSAAFSAGTDFADGTVLDDDYFSFTITPDAGVMLDFSSLSFIDRSGGFSVSVASDQDGFSTVIDSLTAAGSWATNSLNLASLSSTTGATEIRLYFHNGSGNDGVIDNVEISATVISGSPLTGYDAWAAGWSNSIGAATNDFDSDGLNNLLEYAMNGNPTNGLAPTNLPLFTKSGSGFLYIHPKRSDDTNLIYTVETTTNLMDSGSWTNDGYTVNGTNVTGGTLDLVTNDVDTVADEKFIRLKIEQ